MTQTDYCKQTILETLQKTGEISSTDLNKVLKEDVYSRKANVCFGRIRSSS